MLEQVALIMETERLTRKPYPKSCQISTMGSVIKSSVAHILRRAEKNEYLRSGSYF